MIKIFLVVGLFLLTWLSVWGGMNYAEYCWSEKRFLSDQDKIDAVIAVVLEKETLAIDTLDKGIQHYTQIKYDGMEDFKKRNPDCCFIGADLSGDYWSPTFWEKVLGDYSDKLRLNFEGHYIDENGLPKSHPIKWESVVTNCGKMR